MITRLRSRMGPTAPGSASRGYCDKPILRVPSPCRGRDRVGVGFVPFTSISLSSRGFHYPTPPLVLAPHELRELLRRAESTRLPELREPLHDVGRVQRFVDRAVERRD